MNDESRVTLRAYKGLDSDFKCRGFQFSVGGEYVHDGPVVACDSGFHACTKATDVWNYYEPAMSRYAEVELSGKIVPDSQDSKHAASHIKIIRELSRKDFVALVIDEVFKEAKNASSGHSTKNASSGHSTKNASSGHSATNASSGHSAKNASSGDYAKNASSGDYATNAATGEDSVIAAAGANSQAKGAIGTWISLADYDGDKCVGFAIGRIGEDGLQPDTWYRAKGGKLIAIHIGSARPE